jgi:formylmethanofuran dehydrogenase subunit A
MKRHALAAAVLVLSACSGGAPSKSDRDAATASLQAEAAALKRDGEKMNPALGVQATWTIKGVDVVDQPGNANQPYTGTIRFVINSQVRESTGVVENNFERSFKYVYDAGIKQWMLKP